MAYFCLKGPSAEMLTCPFEKNHSVSKYKMYYHLMRCRLNFTKEADRKGERVNVFVCQHNSDHRILAPELKWHEAQCPDRKKVRTYQVNVAKTLQEAGQWPQWMEVLHVQPDPQERKGRNPDVIRGSENFGQPIRMDEVNDPQLKAQREEEKRQKAMEQQKMKEEEERKKKESMTPEEWEEYKDWNKMDETVKSFDYMKVATNPNPLWGRYPVNLSKTQRKDYEKVVRKLYTHAPM